ncbi:hypothetical protein M8J75_015069 [Diaphorina citri]|nr:hypothetical protein M8J75_015069 [Diaphorina citri]KAI5755088.1 hypothetical protein M8J77_013987 [Diaphorina citri]
MSRGCTDDFCISLQKHRNRLLQLAESKSSKAQRHSLKNLYTAPLKKAGNSKQTFSSRKLRSLEEVVRSDPGYTPDIEHLVFQSRPKSVEVLVRTVNITEGHYHPVPPDGIIGDPRHTRLQEETSGFRWEWAEWNRSIIARQSMPEHEFKPTASGLVLY